MQTVSVQPDERRLNRRKEAIRRATSPVQFSSREHGKRRTISSVWRSVSNLVTKNCPPENRSTRAFRVPLIDSGILTRIPREIRDLSLSSSANRQFKGGKKKEKKRKKNSQLSQSGNFSSSWLVTRDPRNIKVIMSYFGNDTFRPISAKNLGSLAAYF